MIDVDFGYTGECPRGWLSLGSASVTCEMKKINKKLKDVGLKSDK